MPTDPALKPDVVDAAFEAFSAAPAVGSRWRHVKGGDYTVVAVAVVEASLVPSVVYRDAAARAWVRSLAEFMDGRFAPADQPGRFTVPAGDVTNVRPVTFSAGPPGPPHMYLGTLRVLGVPHHATFLRVKEGDAVEPLDDAPPEVAAQFDTLQRLYEGDYMRLRLPSVPGLFVLYVTPYDN